MHKNIELVIRIIVDSSTQKLDHNKINTCKLMCTFFVRQFNKSPNNCNWKRGLKILSILWMENTAE